MNEENDILKYYKEELNWNPPFADIFSSYAPEALDGYLQMREYVQNGKLSPKTRELIFTILDTLDGELEGAKAHAKKAISEGLSIEELVETFVIMTMVKGINVMCTGGSEVIKAAEEHYKTLNNTDQKES